MNLTQGNKNKPKAVVLLSGGLDSTTCVAIAKNMGFELYAISFFYEQKHAIEVRCAKTIASDFGAAEHRIINLDLGSASSLIDKNTPVPKDFSPNHTEAPSTYVPARNAVFLSLALSYAESVGASDIFIGVTAVDYSGYRDCRPEFIEAFEKMANLATSAKSPFKIHTPLIKLSKSEIIKTGTKLGVDYSKTHSCYDPTIINDEVYACGKCDSCKFRLLGFEQAGFKDGAKYVPEI